MAPKLTALAEFDLVEAQDFYAPKGAWVLDHFMNSFAEAMDDLERHAGIHPKHYGPHFVPAAVAAAVARAAIARIICFILS